MTYTGDDALKAIWAMEWSRVLSSMREAGPAIRRALLTMILREWCDEVVAVLDRPAVRAYLARDPEAAAKVAGPWHDSREAGRGPERVRHVVGALSWQVGIVWQEADGWHGVARGRFAGVLPSVAEAEAAVDALLAADGWVLGVGEVTGG